MFQSFTEILFCFMLQNTFGHNLTLLDNFQHRMISENRIESNQTKIYISNSTFRISNPIELSTKKRVKSSIRIIHPSPNSHRTEKKQIEAEINEWPPSCLAGFSVKLINNANTVGDAQNFAMLFMASLHLDQKFPLRLSAWLV